MAIDQPDGEILFVPGAQVGRDGIRDRILD